MPKKIISAILVLATVVITFFACAPNNAQENSSGIASVPEMIIGSANEGEYPSFNSDISFSDVSVPLTSEKPSELVNQNSSGGSLSDNKTSSSTTTTSSGISSDYDYSSSKAPTPSQSSTSSKAPVSSSGSPSRLNYSTMKAVWITYIDFANILTGKTETQFRNNFKKVCQNCRDFGINTLICHQRAFGDAYYPSQYFAWSANVAGIGKNPGYDPLKIMVEIAHSYNLSLHAYINPFRAYLDKDVSKVPSTAIFKKWYNDSSKNGKYIVKVSNRWYFNPGEPEVRELIINGIKEIINNYNVDGIHFDDYFYPTTASSFDSSSFSKYGSGKTLANWRKANVNAVVKGVYDAVKAKNKNIIFGISPQANINNCLNMYADVNLWGSQNGYVDYLCPQNYYNYKSESLSFSTALSQWNKLVTASNVKLMIGIAPYRIGGLDTWACTNKSHTETTANCGKYAWRTTTPSKSNILAKQCTDSFALKKCKGVFLYSYVYLFNIDHSFTSANSNGVEYASNAVEQAKYEISALKDALK